MWLLSRFPVVALLGARQTGKSTLVKQVLPQGSHFDLEKQGDLERINADAEFVLKTATEPIAIDEAQIAPSLFPALRVIVDEKREKNGRFLLTGSSSPDLLNNISESLAGRIAIIEVSSFDWDEAFEREPSKFIDVLENKASPTSLNRRFSIEELYELCLHGGYPDPWLQRIDSRFFSLWMENYFTTYIQRDIRTLFPNLKLEAYRRFVRMLGFSSGNIINAASFSRSLDVSQPTIKTYMDIIQGTWVWQRLSPFEENVTKRIVKTPKGYIKDTGLLNWLLKLATVDDLICHPQFGRIWEGFVIEHILRSLRNNLIPFDAFYYRTKNGAEIDLVLELRTGLIPIEIKSGGHTPMKQLKAITEFAIEQDCNFGILINNAEKICWLNKKIVQIPASYL